MGKLIKKTIYVTEGQEKHMKHRAEKAGVSQARYIRNLINFDVQAQKIGEYLKRNVKGSEDEINE